MANVALVEKTSSRTDYIRHFENKFEFDRYQLCSDTTKKKILKRDVDIEIDTDDYEWVILIGSEALQHFTKERAITEHTGRLLNDKFLPMINPAMLAFKPEARKSWDSSVENVKDYISGKLKPVVISTEDFYGITETKEALEWIQYARGTSPPYVAVDTETTGLFPRDGHVLGISLSCEQDKGVYISADCVDDEVSKEMQLLFNEKRVIMQNAKFDLAMLEYHFNFTFPGVDDTMLMHYVLNETPGTHGLKQLAMKTY